MGKHGFAEELHSKLKWLRMKLELIQNFVSSCLDTRVHFNALLFERKWVTL
jgi:hypothetical protein